MKHYEVFKCEPFTFEGKKYYSPVADYGVMCEEDMKLTTRGYKATDINTLMETVIYTRKNSKYCFTVKEV